MGNYPTYLTLGGKKYRLLAEDITSAIYHCDETNQSIMVKFLA